MAKLTRVTNKVFGSEADPNIVGDPEISQFGSALAQTFLGTDDVAQIQELPAWGQGWIGAVTASQQFPALSEMTGAMKVLSYQTAYDQQMGIAEWDSDTTYYKNSYCQVNGTIYKSLTDDNKENDPTTINDNWENVSLMSKISNCIIEDPQKINLTLSDNTLTLKAGSIVCVPNGLDSDGNPVFEEVYIDSDIVLTSVTFSATDPIFIFVRNDGTFLYRQLVSSTTSGTTIPTTGMLYNTSNNLIEYYYNGSIQFTGYSFPIAICTPTGDGTISITSIDQTFQSIGYIGSTVFARKGLKLLIPDGRNADGSLNSIEYTLTSTKTQTNTTGTYTYIVFINTSGNIIQRAVVENTRHYDANMNKWYIDGKYYSFCSIATVDRTVGEISNFKPYSAVKLVTENEITADRFDGQWVNKSLVILAGTMTSGLKTTVDLSSYLPSDNYVYEVSFSAYIRTGTTSGNAVGMTISNEYNDELRLCRCNTRTASTMQASGNATLPIGTSRTFTYFNEDSSGTSGSCGLIARAYRRIGTNS